MNYFSLNFHLRNLNYKIVICSLILGAIVPLLSLIWTMNLWAAGVILIASTLVYGLLLILHFEKQNFPEFTEERMGMNVLFFAIVYSGLYLTFNYWM